MKPSGVVRKLRIKPGMTVLIRDAPSDFASLLSSMADGIKLLKASASRVDCVIAFVRCKADVQARRNVDRLPLPTQTLGRETSSVVSFCPADAFNRTSRRNCRPQL